MANTYRQLKRYESMGCARFLTFSCFHRLQLFNNDSIKDAFVEQLIKTHESLDVDLYGWVVMPEHVHLLIRPRDQKTTVEAISRSLKPAFAQRVVGRWRELDAPILSRLADREGRHHFWQAGGGYDRNIYSEAEFQEKLGYIHNNPVKRGLVERAEDWVWSSALWYTDRVRYSGPSLDAWA